MTKTRSTLVALVLVMLLMLVLVPAATAASGRTAVAGTWGWVNTLAEVKDLPSGGQVIYGEETGTWTGNISGTSFDTFKAVFQPKGEDDWLFVGTLWVNFEGTVNGVSGEMLMRVNFADRGDGFMDGHWSIVKGWDGLEGVSGQGTWIQWYDVEPVPPAVYSGVVKMKLK
jgi:hypothetical protein